MDRNVKISVRNLSKVFGANPELGLEKIKNGWDRERVLKETGAILALNDVSFDIAEGEIFVVMGLSGSGKSTLVRCLNRLIQPTTGEVMVDGVDILKLNDKELREIRLHRMAMVFQHFALLPNRTVVQNVAFGLKVRGISSAKRHATAVEKLRQVGLSEWADKYPHQLSGGMQQRVGLARSLAVEPDILLMDEAFSALDPLIRHEMQHELLELQRTQRRTIIFITHDLDEALLLGNRIAIIKEGQIVQIGTPQEILDKPANEYVASFVRGVDRGKVFTARDISVVYESISLNTSTSDAAKALQYCQPQEYLVVVDDHNRPVGFVESNELTGDLKVPHIAQYMNKKFDTVTEEAKLVEVYAMFQEDLQIFTVDGTGALTGIIDPRKLLAKLATKKEVKH